MRPEEQAPDSVADAFRKGWDEGLGGLGLTYDDDPESERSRAYDAGRTARRVHEHIEEPA